MTKDVMHIKEIKIAQQHLQENLCQMQYQKNPKLIF